MCIGVAQSFLATVVVLHSISCKVNNLVHLVHWFEATMHRCCSLSRYPMGEGLNTDISNCRMYFSRWLEVTFWGGGEGRGFTAHQDYFIHFEPSQLWVRAKTGDPEKKHLTTRKQNLARLMWPELGSNPQKWDDERFRAISVLNHLAMGRPKRHCFIVSSV